MSQEVTPKYEASAFTCPHCKVHARQDWQDLFVLSGSHEAGGGYEMINGLKRATCANCRRHTIWCEKQMVYPARAKPSPPNPDLGPDARQDFSEAAAVAEDSPRAACALMRLCLQKLVKQLGRDGRNMSRDLSGLIRGLPREAWDILTSLRVVGPKAVVPGMIDAGDCQRTAANLFAFTNLAAQILISNPKRIREIRCAMPPPCPPAKT